MSGALASSPAEERINLLEAHLATKPDIAAVKADIAAVNTDIAAVEAALKADLAAIEAALKTDLAAIEAALKADLATVKRDIAMAETNLALKTEAAKGDLLQWMIAALIAQGAVVVALVTLLR